MPRDIAALILVVHALYWGIIIWRYGLRYVDTLENTGYSADAEPVSVQSVSSPKAGLAVFLVSLGIIAYYILVMLWWHKYELVGPMIFKSSFFIQLIGIILIIVSLALRLWAFRVFRSWRLFVQVDQGHSLVTNGPYAWVRHPLYLSMLLLYAGSFLLIPRLGFMFQMLALILAYIFRINVEEEILVCAFKDEYKDYMQKTFRLIPWVY